jgi:hypothetical protein
VLTILTEVGLTVLVLLFTELAPTALAIRTDLVLTVLTFLTELFFYCTSECAAPPPLPPPPLTITTFTINVPPLSLPPPLRREMMRYFYTRKRMPLRFPFDPSFEHSLLRPFVRSFLRSFIPAFFPSLLLFFVTSFLPSCPLAVLPSCRLAVLPSYLINLFLLSCLLAS